MDRIIVILAVTTCLSAGVLFVLAGWSKTAWPPAVLVKWLESLRIVPRWAVRPVAVALPVVECAVGWAVLTGASGPAAEAAAAVLLVGFAAVAGVILVRGGVVDCGCLGPFSRRLLSWRTVTRNLLLATACTWVALSGLTWGAVALPGWAQAALTLTLTLLALGAARRHRPIPQSPLTGKAPASGSPADAGRNDHDSDVQNT
ncbi:MauE/DoxX family redox-associated membrane protein [Streptomyces syringium]|uniref:MauE/DoxX family redox-associated membrane protein n=1 Tax=Streptomyces syringium TaxID=76729 RepID=UPI0034030D8B